MKSIVKQSNRKAAFTIIELLTVMSIIIILIGLLVPSLNMARRFARKLTQKNQLRTIGIAIEFFNNEWDGYPSSTALGGEGQPYCGAMKLCEAMVGQDLMVNTVRLTTYTILTGNTDNNGFGEAENKQQ